MTARQDDAVTAAVIHQLRDKWSTPEEAVVALNLPLSKVQRWWSNDAEKMTWTTAMNAQYGKFPRSDRPARVTRLSALIGGADGGPS